MKRFLVFLAAVLFVLSAVGLAEATSFTLNDYGVAANYSDPGLVIGGEDILPQPFSFHLNVGDTIKFDLFRIYTNEDWVSSPPDEDANPKVIEASLDLSAKYSADFGASILGKTYGSLPLQKGVLDWDNPQTLVNFGWLGTGEILVSLSDETFGLEGWENGAIVEATLTYQTAPIPEPATILLLGSGMVGLAGFGRKKFGKKIKA